MFNLWSTKIPDPYSIWYGSPHPIIIPLIFFLSKCRSLDDRVTSSYWLKERLSYSKDTTQSHQNSSCLFLAASTDSAKESNPTSGIPQLTLKQYTYQRDQVVQQGISGTTFSSNWILLGLNLADYLAADSKKGCCHISRQVGLNVIIMKNEPLPHFHIYSTSCHLDIVPSYILVHQAMLKREWCSLQCF